MAKLDTRTDGTSEMLAAQTANMLDGVKTLLLASTLAGTEDRALDLEEEQKRLEGASAPDQNRIAAIAAQADSLRSAIPVMISRFERSRSSRVPVPGDVAILTGRVFDQDTNIGIENARVVAVNPQGSTASRTVTDAGGSFELLLNEKVLTGVSLEVRVGRNVVFSDAKPMKLELGNRYYRDIPVSGGPCGGSSGTGSTTKGSDTTTRTKRTPAAKREKPAE
jgi:hypothetical protein